MSIHHVPLVLCALSALALAACGSGQPNAESSAASAGSEAAASATSEEGLRYHAELALAGQPEVTAEGKNIRVTVNVTNDGPGVFGSANTPHPVNLGAHSIDASGKIVDLDLARGQLPQIASGATGKSSILLPVDKTLGHRVELLPVEELVNWFDAWGTKPLVVGPFVACSNPSSGKVCDADGKPLPTAPAAQ